MQDTEQHPTTQDSKPCLAALMAASLQCLAMQADGLQIEPQPSSLHELMSHNAPTPRNPFNRQA